MLSVEVNIRIILFIVFINNIVKYNTYTITIKKLIIIKNSSKLN